MSLDQENVKVRLLDVSSDSYLESGCSINYEVGVKYEKGFLCAETSCCCKDYTVH
jgi:hypothetical protein